MSRPPTRQTSSPQWRAMKRLRASEGACPNSTFITGTGATNTSRTPAVARPVINRINSMWAASMVVLPQQQMMSGRAPRMGAPARDSHLLAAVALIISSICFFLLVPKLRSGIGVNGFKRAKRHSELLRKQEGERWPEGARSPFPQVGREAPAGIPEERWRGQDGRRGGRQPGTGAGPASTTILAVFLIRGVAWRLDWLQSKMDQWLLAPINFAEV